MGSFTFEDGGQPFQGETSGGCAQPNEKPVEKYTCCATSTSDNNATIHIEHRGFGPSKPSVADRHPCLTTVASNLLDHNSGIPPTHCGRAASLQFVLAVKQLKIQDRERIRPEDWLRFFPSENKATGLVLNNGPGLWQRCAKAIKKMFQAHLTLHIFFLHIFPFS